MEWLLNRAGGRLARVCDKLVTKSLLIHALPFQGANHAPIVELNLTILCTSSGCKCKNWAAAKNVFGGIGHFIEIEDLVRSISIYVISSKNISSTAFCQFKRKCWNFWMKCRLNLQPFCFWINCKGNHLRQVAFFYIVLKDRKYNTKILHFLGKMAQKVPYL